MNFVSSGIYLGVLVTSLSGSLHCVGMCGGLMLNVAHNQKENALYHGGRLLAYLALGTGAGYLGSTLLTSPFLASLQMILSALVGIFFLWMAYRMWKGVPFHFSLIPAPLVLKLQTLTSRSRIFSPAFLIGLSSGILPCGWLNTFVIAALATRSPWSGSLLLFFFWMGTVPALVISHATLNRFKIPLARFSTKILAVFLVVLGISNLGLKSFSFFHPTGSAMSSDCPMHSHH